MKRLLIALGTAAGACVIAMPAAAGLSGNPAFSEGVQVRVPASAAVVSFDDHGKLTEPGDDRGRRHTEPGDDRHRGHGSATRTSTAGTASATEPGDDRGDRHPEPGEDRHRGHGSATPTSTAGTASATEPGDDRGGRHPEPGEDKRRGRGHGGDD